MTELTPKNFRYMCPLLKQGFRILRLTDSSVVIQNNTLQTGSVYNVSAGLGMRAATGEELARQAISKVCDDCEHNDGSIKTGMVLNVAKGKCDPRTVDNNKATIEARIGV